MEGGAGVVVVQQIGARIEIAKVKTNGMEKWELAVVLHIAYTS